MVMLNKKQKEMEVMNLTMNLTQMRIMIANGLCTEEEYNEHSKVIVQAYQESLQNKEDLNQTLQRLSALEVKKKRSWKK